MLVPDGCLVQHQPRRGDAYGSSPTRPQRVGRVCVTALFVLAGIVAGVGLPSTAAQAKAACGVTPSNRCGISLYKIYKDGTCGNGYVCLKVGSKETWNYATSGSSKSWSGGSTPAAKFIRNRQSSSKRPICGYQLVNFGGQWTHHTYNFNGYFAPTTFSSFESFMATPYGASPYDAC